MTDTLITKQFLAKYFFRLFHIAPIIALSGKIITDYLFGASGTLSKGEKAFYAISGALIVLSGIINTFVILKPKQNMGPRSKLWSMISHSKLLLSVIFFTPIVNTFTNAQSKLTIQFWLSVAFILASPFMRYYREYYTALNEDLKGETNKRRN